MLKHQKKALAEFLGYIYFEPKVIVDSATISTKDIYSKLPIEVEEFDYPGEIDENVIMEFGEEGLTQKYFKDVPNPDYGIDPDLDDLLSDNYIKPRFDTSIEKLPWGTIHFGEYVYSEFFDQFADDFNLQMEFFEKQRNFQLVLNDEKVGLYKKDSNEYLIVKSNSSAIIGEPPLWKDCLFELIMKFIQKYPKTK